MADRPTVIVQPGSANDPVRDECFRGMQLACAGATIASALCAHIDSLAAVIAVAATDRANADDILESIGRDLRKAVDDNWTLIKEQIAESVREVGHG